MIERIDAVGLGLGVAVDQQPHARRFGGLVAEGIHLLEFPHRIDVEQGKRRGGGEEGLARQMQQDGGILAAREQHHGPFALGRDLSQDVDGLGLEPAQYVVVQPHGPSRCANLPVTPESRGAKPAALMPRTGTGRKRRSASAPGFGYIQS